MPTIEFSQGWQANQQLKLRTGQSTTLWGHMPLHQYNTSASYGITRVRVFKGTPVDPTTYISNYNTYWTPDGLLLWDVNSMSYTAETDRLNFYSTAPAAAVQSGTATWFWYGQEIVSSNQVVFFYGIGTVGGVGSGADMVITSTDVVGGELYNFSHLQFVIPTVFTY